MRMVMGNGPDVCFFCGIELVQGKVHVFTHSRHPRKCCYMCWHKATKRVFLRPLDDSWDKERA